jgi:hypothetical protein
VDLSPHAKNVVSQQRWLLFRSDRKSNRARAQAHERQPTF